MRDLSFSSVRPTPAERAEARAGDGLVEPVDVVMDRAFTVPGSPAEVWPWVVQLGKWRAGWYLPRGVERFVPPARRATRTVEDRWQGLQPGDTIPDYGGRDETFTVAEVEGPHVLVYTSTRGRVHLSWSITLRVQPRGNTRVLLRLRLGPVRRVWLARTAGELVDLLTIAGMAAGLRERLESAVGEEGEGGPNRT